MRRGVLLGLLGLAACGGGGHHTSDASPYDAPADTLPVSGDGGAGSVTLRITTGGQPIANVVTVFLDAHDSQVAAVTTNAAGIAAARVGAGGSVTAVLHEGAGLDHLMTFTAVQPGDALELALSPASADPAPPITLTAPTNGSLAYDLFGSCGDPVSSSNGTFGFTPTGCGGEADFVIESTDDNVTPTGFLVATGVSIGATTALSGAFTPAVSQTYAYTSVPSAVVNIATRAVVLGHGAQMYAAASAQSVSGASSLTVHEPMPDTTGLGISAFVVSNLYPQDTELGQQTVFDVVDAAMPYNLAVSQAMLPRYLTAPAYDVASRSVAWGEAPGGAAVSFVRARIHANRGDSGRSWTWQIASARTATSVTFPALPAFDGFSYVPIASDTVGVDELTTADIAGGYTGVRAHAFGAIGADLTSGHAAVETLFTPNL